MADYLFWSPIKDLYFVFFFPSEFG